jgi:hypothetical protein
MPEYFKMIFMSPGNYGKIFGDENFFYLQQYAQDLSIFQWNSVNYN